MKTTLKTDLRLIREYNKQVWARQAKRNFETSFGAGIMGEINMTETDDGMIQANFKYKLNFEWNCTFSFDQNKSTYSCNCTSPEKSGVVSGEVVAGIQEGIRDSIRKAKEELIAQDSESFRQGGGRNKF